MPYLGLGLHVVVAIYFAVHAMRSGQDRYWLMILFMFPLLGSVVYALAIWLPDLRHSYQGRTLVRGVRQVLDPTRELRAAQDAFETTATVENRLRLADALLAAGRASEAVPQYQSTLSGIHRDDPDIQVRLAGALLESGHATAARELLDELIRRRPDFRSQPGHLTYARAVAAEGNRAKAREEFETLIGYASGYEAAARYAEVLHGWGESQRAREVCTTALAQAKRLPGYARKLNKSSLAQLQQLSAQIDKAS
ncbi:MAG TPA: tetratricopeptide repeat protein [Lysobacter sp.]